MALSRVKVWSAGEILYALDLNSEFNNVLNNALSLISPLTASLNAGGFKITNYGGTDAPTAVTDVALNAFVQAGTGATTRTLQDELRDTVSVFQYLTTAEIADVRARTKLVDVTTNAQKAIDYAKANDKALHWPAGTYHTTLSLDCTFTNDSNARFLMYGDGKEVTIIHGDLSELYPIVDYTGNTYGELRDMTVTSTGITSKATAALLCSKIGTGSLGNTVLVQNCILSVTTTGNVNAVMGVVFNNTDLSKCIGCEIAGPGGVTAGFTKSASVTSKYQTVSATTDSTLFVFERCSITGDSAPALEYTGGAVISLRDTYCVLTGGGTAGCVIKVSSSSGTSGNAINADGLRTENQSAATAVNAIQLSASSARSFIAATLETDALGAAFNIAAGKGISGKLIIHRTNGAIFAGDQTVTDIELFTNCTDIGAISSSSYNLNIGGAISLVNAFAQAQNGVRVSQASLTYESMFKLLVPPTEVTQILRPTGNFSQLGIAQSAYTGGSGEQLVYSYTVKGAMLTAWSAQLSNPMALIEWVGTTAAASGINGRIRINLIQGAGNVDILDTGAAIPAGQGNFRLTSKLLSVGGTNSRTYCELLWVGASTYNLNKFTNTQATIVFNADFSINVYITNTGNNPYSFNVQTGLLG